MKVIITHPPEPGRNFTIELGERLPFCVKIIYPNGDVQEETFFDRSSAESFIRGLMHEKK